MSDMLYTCGATVSEFKNSTDPNNRCYSILDKALSVQTIIALNPWSHYTAHAIIPNVAVTVAQNGDLQQKQ